MGKPPPNLMDNPIIKPYKSNYCSKKAKGLMSSFAFLFFIVIFIFIFYTFKLSLSSLFGNTKFWFIIFNSLIIIIAADYDAFSSSKEICDFYEEYAMRSQVRNVSSFISQYPDIAKKITTSKDNLQEKEVVIINYPTHEIPEKILEAVVTEEHGKPNRNFQSKKQENEPKINKEACDTSNIIEARIYRRNKSEKANRVVIDESKNILHRPETEKREKCIEKKVEENEFLTMSDEELNRRVEEFIQRFNKQIRLQGVRSHQI